MTKEEYEDFALRYKGCGACFPMYHTLSRFEKMWFTAIQKDVAELEAYNKKLLQSDIDKQNKIVLLSQKVNDLQKENAKLKRSRWHNLRKNPQDLPKEDSAVLVVDMDYGHPDYKVALFWKEDGAFTGHYLAKLDVIAWREIPVFQEGA